MKHPQREELETNARQGTTMSASELNDLKQLAMVAELARPLAHEYNNFLNNLLLQLAISEKSFPESSRADWANIRREGKKLANLVQQWQRQHAAETPLKIELRPLIEELVNELRLEFTTTPFLVRHASGPLFLRASKAEVQRLFSLALRYAVAAQRSYGAKGEVIEMEVGMQGDRILIALHHAGATWADFGDVASSERATLSLSALACKSLAERLQGHIRSEADGNGSMALVVDLPTAG